MPITLSNQTGPLGKDLFGGSQLGSVERWVEVGTPEGPILVMIFSTSERGLEMVWEAVQPIIETVEIGN